MQEITVELDGFAHGGEAVGTLEGEAHGEGGKRVFVAGALPGEKVRAELTLDKKRYAKARVLEVLEASPARITPPCELADRCGGCNWQYVDPKKQALFKAEIAANQLRFVVPQVDAVYPSPQLLGYRRRARLHVHKGPDGLAIGFYAKHSTQVVALTRCLVLLPELSAILPWLPKLEPFLIDGAQIHLLASQGKVLIGVSGVCPKSEARPRVEALLDESPESLAGLEFRGKRQRMAFGAKTLVLQDAPAEQRFAALRCSPFDFAQAQDEQNKQILSLVQEHVAKAKGTVLELYCGAGNLTRVLTGAQRNVEAWDDARGSIDVLRRRAQKDESTALWVNQGTALKALRRARERGRRFDWLVVDPPRTGLGAAVVKEILALGPTQMVYVSCDPSTLARDLKALEVGGYRCEHAAMVDMMPMTSEIEMVLRLKKSNGSKAT